jgi:hypothetical protein
MTKTVELTIKPEDVEVVEITTDPQVVVSTAAVAGIQGPKGNKGDKGDKGDKGNDAVIEVISYEQIDSFFR